MSYATNSIIVVVIVASNLPDLDFVTLKKKSNEQQQNLETLN